MGSAESLMPLHSVTASALLTSMLSVKSKNWGWLSEGTLLFLISFPIILVLLFVPFIFMLANSEYYFPWWNGIWISFCYLLLCAIDILLSILYLKFVDSRPTFWFEYFEKIVIHQHGVLQKLHLSWPLQISNPQKSADLKIRGHIPVLPLSFQFEKFLSFPCEENLF